MLTLPKSLRIKRAKQAENSLLEKSRKWLEGEYRDPRIHVSDLLDPLMGYWQRMKPKKLSDKLVSMFMIGKVLHAIVLSAVDGKKGIDFASDQGSKFSKELGISYSQDHNIKGIPRELKSTRTFYEPKTIDDLSLYCEQLLCYVAAEFKQKGQLWLKMLNLKDKKTGRTNPAFRCYTITADERDMEIYRDQIKGTRILLEHALKKKDPSKLPLCRAWKCGEGNCEWWKDCKPKGRYGIKNKKDWKK